MGEVHCETVGSRFPGRILRARNLAFPFEHVGSAIRIGDWLGYESEGMLKTPLFSLLFETVDHQLVHLQLFSHLKSAKYYSKSIVICIFTTISIELIDETVGKRIEALK